MAGKAIRRNRQEGETIEDTKARLAEEKAKARQERNAAQAIEEKEAWQEIAKGAQEAASKLVPVKGRPPIWIGEKREKAETEILTRLAVGQSLQSICRMDDMPSITAVQDWIAESPAFASRYMRAREQCAHVLFDQCIDIADDTSQDVLEDGSANHAAIARAKLRIDTRLRMAGKLSPKVYGERIEALAGAGNVTVNALTIDARALSPDQRDNLRHMLTSAMGAAGNAGKIIDHD